MKRIAVLLFAVAMVSGVVTVQRRNIYTDQRASRQTDRGPPVPELLAQGIVWITWRAENVNIVPVSGKDALNASPRVGHLHIHVDDLPWLWAHIVLPRSTWPGCRPARTRCGSNW